MKSYIKPEVTVVEVSVKTSLLVASTGVGSDDYGIAFGGTDYEGSLEPESRKNDNLWDCSW